MLYQKIWQPSLHQQQKNNLGRGKKRMWFRPGLPDLSFFNIPKHWKIYQIATKYPNGHKICITNGCNLFQIAILYTNLFHLKVFQSLPKFGFLFWKTYHLATLVPTIVFSRQKVVVRRSIRDQGQGTRRR
jgi:hypothetical protein